MLSLIIISPFIGCIMSGLFGRNFGRQGVVIITTFGIIISWVSSIILFLSTSFNNNTQYLYLGDWLNFYLFSVKWCFLFDNLTVIMLLTVTTVSLIVHIYSYDYMYYDPHLPRFMSYLSLFTFFMLVLLTANNFIQLFLGWEGVGLCSYLLINFWFTRIPANKAAIKAVLYNRIGDIALLIAISLLFYLTKSLDFSIIFLLVPYLWTKTVCISSCSIGVLNLIGFLLVIGAAGKSAQLGLHTWLPSAMEGPTPVSALIHAATMVTAGIFLIIRCSFIFEFIPLVLNIILCLGGLTTIFAATTALVQNDLKKIVAYSTCSQLGYMILTCGLSNYSLSLFHLVNHAFFKALLFLTCGLVIHALFDEQDIRKMGNLVVRLPAAYIFMLIASLALIGFPFCAGYYSKDLIIETLYLQQNVVTNFVYYISITTAILTTIYSTRLLFFVFLSNPNGFKRIFLNLHFNNFFIILLLSFLLFGSIFSGYFLKEIFIGIGSNFFSTSIFNKNNLTLLDCEFMPLYIKLLPTIFSISFFGLAYYCYCSTPVYNHLILIQRHFITLYNFFANSWYFDKFFNFIASYSFYWSYEYIFKIVDKGLLEVFGPYGLTSFFNSNSKRILKFHDGYLYSYIMLFLFSITTLLSIFL